MSIDDDDPIAAPRGLALVAAAMLGLVAAPMPAPASAATMTVVLCGGGVVHLDLGGGRNPVDPPGACHAACLMRRDDDGKTGDISLS